MKPHTTTVHGNHTCTFKTGHAHLDDPQRRALVATCQIALGDLAPGDPDYALISSVNAGMTSSPPEADLWARETGEVVATLSTYADQTSSKAQAHQALATISAAIPEPPSPPCPQGQGGDRVVITSP